MLTSIEVDASKLNEHMKSLDGSKRDQWLINVKEVLTMVSKCINGERYIEAAQLIFAVFKILTMYCFSILLKFDHSFRLFIKRLNWMYNQI